MNNSYDREYQNIPTDFQLAEEAKTRQEARSVLALIQHQQHIKKVRAEAIRAQYISPKDEF